MRLLAPPIRARLCQLGRFANVNGVARASQVLRVVATASAVGILGELQFRLRRSGGPAKVRRQESRWLAARYKIDVEKDLASIFPLPADKDNRWLARGTLRIGAPNRPLNTSVEL
jgi:hypothetical protein